MATMRGEPTDRPPVSFYELNGLDENPANASSFNIYSHPSWQPLLELTRTTTDRIVMRAATLANVPPNPVDERSTTKTYLQDGRRFTQQRVRADTRTLTAQSRQDPDVNTVWTTEHLLKDVDDLKAFLKLPQPRAGGTVCTTSVTEAEVALGDTGIVMLDTPDPLCLAASLFAMADYTVIALTEPALFCQLLDRFAAVVLPRTAAIAQALPGRLWRIYGPEYAAPPYLPPPLFREYVCRYVQPMIAAIHRHGGYARIHSHGRLKAILNDIAGMGADALDPVEPPPQGDVELAYVREHYGATLVLFGNLEISDIETMPTPQFAEKVKRALAEGTAGPSRGFVLMPSACPYGRELSRLTLRNYEKIIALHAAWAR